MYRERIKEYRFVTYGKFKKVQVLEVLKEKYCGTNVIGCAVYKDKWKKADIHEAWHIIHELRKLKKEKNNSTTNRI